MNNSEAFSCPSDYDSDQEWLHYSIPVEPRLFDFIAQDNKDAFVQRIKYGRSRSELYDDWYQSPEVLFEIFNQIAMYNAVKCATALLAGKAGFRGGKLVETTALLLVAREEITSPSFFKDFTSSGSMSLHQLVSLGIESLKASETKSDSTDEEIHESGNKLETMNFMLRMIKVLESVGPEIDQYCQDLPKLRMEELATKVAYLLISRGFVEYEDLKRSVLSETSLKSYQHFLKLLESKLHGDIEGSHLESKDVAGTMTPPFQKPEIAFCW
ncbi:hypothetical protein GQ457_02G037500 [Hibiscus cannabinus]